MIEALLKIANNKEFMKYCEPNVMQPLHLKKWMIVRVLKAQELFNEWEIQQDAGEGLQETSIPD